MPDYLVDHEADELLAELRVELGIDGEGFFVLDAGTRDVYTRAGVFGLDSGHNLVDTATGFKVRGVDGQDINLPIDTLLPARTTLK